MGDLLVEYEIRPNQCLNIPAHDMRDNLCCIAYNVVCLNINKGYLLMLLMFYLIFIRELSILSQAL